MRSRNPYGIWFLPCNFQHVPKSTHESCSWREVVGEGFGASGLYLLNQQLDIGGDEFVFGTGSLLSMAVTLLAIAVLLMVSLLCYCFCFSCRARDVPACRTPSGEGGGRKCKERGITHPCNEA
jgi:hypothetical protein